MAALLLFGWNGFLVTGLKIQYDEVVNGQCESNGPIFRTSVPRQT